MMIFGALVGQRFLRTLCWAVFIVITDSFESRFDFVHGIEVAINGMVVSRGVGVGTRGS